MNEDREKLSEQ